MARRRKTTESRERPLSANMEDYMEAIFHIVTERKVARVKEIAEAVGVWMASVTSAVQTLAEKGLVAHDKFGYVDVTPEGADLADRIVRRHRVLTSFMIDVLGLDPSLAEQEACQMEHSISRATLERLTRFAEFLQTCPRAGTDWLERFHVSCKRGKRDMDCAECVEECDRNLAKAEFE